MPVALLYHDVIVGEDFDASGFPGPGAARYKLTHKDFLSHLDAIQGAMAGASPPLLTFDDGGSSSVAIADELDRRGWKGLFFVTTDRIDSPGFVTEDQIRNLNERGHTIGTHSCSHPARISACDPDTLAHEWLESRGVLTEILGEFVTIGSVPGGYYSHQVAEAAAKAGLLRLFTSEPTRKSWVVEGCTVLGRYSIRRGDSVAAVARLADACLAPRVSQWVSWNAKKLAKAVAGPFYNELRSRILARKARSHIA
jgi:peptidoglycan/xylan/chitin deacetylase (PgdA/CDA1 family)